MNEHFYPCYMFSIPNPQIGSVLVRSVYNGGKETFQDCCSDWSLVTATPFYIGVSRDEVLSLGGVVVKSRDTKGVESPVN